MVDATKVGSKIASKTDDTAKLTNRTSSSVDNNKIAGFPNPLKLIDDVVPNPASFIGMASALGVLGGNPQMLIDKYNEYTLDPVKKWGEEQYKYFQEYLQSQKNNKNKQ